MCIAAENAFCAQRLGAACDVGSRCMYIIIRQAMHVYNYMDMYIF